MAQPRAVALRASNDRLLDELQLLRQKVAEHERREVVMREDLSAASKHIRTLMEPNVAARVFSIGSKADEAAFTAAEPEFSRGEIAMFDRGFSAPRVRRYVGAPSRPSSARSAPSTPRSLLLGAAARRPAGRPTARPRRPASALPRVDAGAGGAAMAAARAGVERTMALLGAEAPPETTPVDDAPSLGAGASADDAVAAACHSLHARSRCTHIKLLDELSEPSAPSAEPSEADDGDDDGDAGGDGDAFAGARAAAAGAAVALLRVESRLMREVLRCADAAAMARCFEAVVRPAVGAAWLTVWLVRRPAGAPEDELVANPTAEYEVRFPVSRAPALLADALAGAPPRALADGAAAGDAELSRRLTSEGRGSKVPRGPAIVVPVREYGEGGAAAPGAVRGVALAIFDRHYDRAAKQLPPFAALAERLAAVLERVVHAPAAAGGALAGVCLAPPRELADALLPRVSRALHAKRAVLWILTPGGGALQPLLPPGARKKVAAAAAALAVPLHGHPHGLVPHVFKTGRPARMHGALLQPGVTDATECRYDPDVDNVMKLPGGPGCLMAIPLFSRRAADGGGGDGDDDAGGGRVIGVLHLLGKEAGGGMFTPREEAVATLLAPRVAALLEDAQHLEAARLRAARAEAELDRARAEAAPAAHVAALTDATARARAAGERADGLERELESAHARLAKLDAEKRGSDEAIARLEAQLGEARQAAYSRARSDYE